MKEITVKIPGYTLSGLTWGDPKNPPILALHGWLDNAHSFLSLAPFIHDKYFLIAVDLPGHGHSSHLPDGYNYHFFDAIFVVTQLIKALNVGKVHLLGHSMGACLISLVAGVSPKLIQSAYFIEALGPFSAPGDTACKQFVAYDEFLTTKEANKKHPGYDQFQSAVRARAAKGYVSTEIAEILCQRGLIEINDRYYWRHDSRLLAPSPLRMTEEQILSCLKHITVPTELLVGHEGFSFDDVIMAHRINAVSQLKVIELKGGHHIHMEKPEAVAQLLVEFLAQIKN